MGKTDKKLVNEVRVKMIKNAIIDRTVKEVKYINSVLGGNRKVATVLVMIFDNGTTLELTGGEIGDIPIFRIVK